MDGFTDEIYRGIWERGSIPAETYTSGVRNEFCPILQPGCDWSLHKVDLPSAPIRAGWCLVDD